MFILIDQVIHLLLERVDDQVKLVSLIDQLSNGGESSAELDLFTVELRSVLVTHRHGLDHLLMNVDQFFVFLLTFVLEDIDFVLENLDTFFHLSQVLATSLNLTDILVSRILDLFVQRNEGI